MEYLRWLLARCALAFAIEDEARLAWELADGSALLAAELMLDAEQRLSDAISAAIRDIEASPPLPALISVHAALLRYLAWRLGVSDAVVALLVASLVDAANAEIERSAADGLRLHAEFTAALRQVRGA